MKRKRIDSWPSSGWLYYILQDSNRTQGPWDGNQALSTIFILLLDREEKMCQLLDFNIRLAALHKQYRSSRIFYWAWNLYYTNDCHVDDDDSDAVSMYCSCLKTFSAAAAATMEKKRYVIVHIYWNSICMDFKIVISSISMLSSLSVNTIFFVIWHIMSNVVTLFHQSTHWIS